MESQMERRWSMKWELGLSRGHAGITSSTILFQTATPLTFNIPFGMLYILATCNIVGVWVQYWREGFLTLYQGGLDFGFY